MTDAPGSRLKIEQARPDLPGRAIGALKGGLRAIALVIYTILFGELFLRLLAPQPLMPRYITGAPWGVRRNIPDSDYRHTTAETDVRFHINHAGMRLDHEVEPAKPAGTCRIAMIGDSFFMGYELNYPDTIGARLEKRLRDDGFNVEVLNFAVSGFGTSEALVTYDRYARTFAPDLVLQEWDKTDFNDNVRSDLYDIQDGALKQVNDSYLPGVDLQDRLNRYRAYRFVSENIQIYGFAREIIGNYLKDITVGIPAALDRMRGFFLPAEAPAPATIQDASKRPFTDPRRDVTDDAMVLSSALLQEFNRRTAADGVGFVLLEIPFQLSDASVLSSLKAMPDQTFAGIDVVSAVDEFNRAMGKGDKLYYKKGAGHFTPGGAALLVEKAAPVLERHPSLAKCRIR